MTNHGVKALAESALARVKEARTGIIVALLIASACATLAAAKSVLEIRAGNRTIAALAANEDVAVDPRATAGDVLIARMDYVLRQGRRDEAQALADTSRNGRATPSERARLLTLLANSRVRTALALIEAGRHDEAIPEVRLAKDTYREALRLDPVLWDAKHNYDVAMRLVRDLPRERPTTKTCRPMLQSSSGRTFPAFREVCRNAPERR